MIGKAFQVGEAAVRGNQDGVPTVAHQGKQLSEEFSFGKSVNANGRLVENDHFGTAGKGENQGKFYSVAKREGSNFGRRFDLETREQVVAIGLIPVVVKAANEEDSTPYFIPVGIASMEPAAPKQN